MLRYIHLLYTVHLHNLAHILDATHVFGKVADILDAVCKDCQQVDMNEKNVWRCGETQTTLKDNTFLKVRILWNEALIEAKRRYFMNRTVNETHKQPMMLQKTGEKPRFKSINDMEKLGQFSVRTDVFALLICINSHTYQQYSWSDSLAATNKSTVWYSMVHKRKLFMTKNASWNFQNSD